MLMALAAAALLADCVPARWSSGDPKSLDLLAGSSINCLLVDTPHWTTSLVREGHRRGFRMLALLDAGTSKAPVDADGVVTLNPRGEIHSVSGVAATDQGVWPGIRIDDEAISTPSSAPWIATNLGFLRYLRSQFTDAVWLANRPPPDKHVSMRGYEQAFSDCALEGAHWVISPGDSMMKSLLQNDSKMLNEWKELLQFADFQRSLPDLRTLVPYSRLGVKVSPQTGALVSGGVLDMIGSQHIPFQVVNSAQGMQEFFDFSDPALVNFPKTSLGRLAIRPGDVDDLEPLYRRVEVTVGRTNYGMRVFNGAGSLSSPFALANGQGVLILLVNYTDLPVQDITLHVLGSWKKATLTSPGRKSRPLVTYAVKTATAVEVDSLDVLAAIKIE